jgi:hypothetical protein
VIRMRMQPGHIDLMTTNTVIQKWWRVRGQTGSSGPIGTMHLNSEKLNFCRMARCYVWWSLRTRVKEKKMGVLLRPTEWRMLCQVI